MRVSYKHTKDLVGCELVTDTQRIWVGAIWLLSVVGDVVLNAFGWVRVGYRHRKHLGGFELVTDKKEFGWMRVSYRHTNHLGGCALVTDTQSIWLGAS